MSVNWRMESAYDGADDAVMVWNENDREELLAVTPEQMQKDLLEMYRKDEFPIPEGCDVPEEYCRIWAENWRRQIEACAGLR